MATNRIRDWLATQIALTFGYEPRYDRAAGIPPDPGAGKWRPGTKPDTRIPRPPPTPAPRPYRESELRRAIREAAREVANANR